MFTLAHEVAHLWLGESALSNPDMDQNALAATTNNQRAKQQEVEPWCNAVAAELLVPRKLFQAELRKEPLPDALRRLTSYFKVSSLVILRRMRDVRYLNRDEYTKAYKEELYRIMALHRKPGGSFYLSQPYKLSRLFSKALITSTLEGHTLYRDAMRMLGVKKASTFNELGRNLVLAP